MDPSELKNISNQLGATCSIMVHAVCKLYLASPNFNVEVNETVRRFPQLKAAPNRWHAILWGGIVAVVDRSVNTTYLQIYNLKTKNTVKLFEYELYNDLQYVSLDPTFHTFEMDDCVAGLSFPNGEMGRKFLSKVSSLIPKTETIFEDHTKKKVPALFGFGGSFILKGSNNNNNNEGAVAAEISAPTAVTHMQHAGVTANGEVDFVNLAPEWKAVFKNAGIRKKDLQNPDTRRVVLQSIALSGYNISSSPSKYQQVEQEPDFEVPPPPPIEQRPLTFTKAELKKNDYNQQQIQAYEAYLKEMEKYEKEMKRFEQEQEKYLRELAEYERMVALEQWERDNAAKVMELKIASEKQDGKKAAAPPPLPPRAKKQQTKPPQAVVAPTIITAPAPKAPVLPNLKNGVNPVDSLKKMERPNSKMFINAMSNMKPPAAPQEQQTQLVLDKSKAADLLNVLQLAMKSRRGHLENQDDEDDWSE